MTKASAFYREGEPNKVSLHLDTYKVGKLYDILNEEHIKASKSIDKELAEHLRSIMDVCEYGLNISAVLDELNRPTKGGRGW